MSVGLVSVNTNWVLRSGAGHHRSSSEMLAICARNDAATGGGRNGSVVGPTLQAMVVRAYSYLGVGDLDAAISTGREAVQLSESLGETWERGIAYQLLAGASLG